MTICQSVGPRMGLVMRSCDVVRSRFENAQRWFTQINGFWSYFPKPLGNHWETIGKPLGNHWETNLDPIWRTGLWSWLDFFVFPRANTWKNRVLASLEDHPRKRWYLSPWWYLVIVFFFSKKNVGYPWLSHVSAGWTKSRWSFPGPQPFWDAI